MSDPEERADGPFDIPRRPERRYPHSGGVEYAGDTVFSLVPNPPQNDRQLETLVERVLSGDGYTYGDWFDLPMPLYLVHDERTGDVFRVSVRDGSVRLHVLPATDSPGLEGLYDRLRAETNLDWSVDIDTERPS